MTMLKCVTINTKKGKEDYDVVTNWSVTDMNESIVASGYPMKDDLPQLHLTNDYPSVYERDCTRAEKLATVPIGSGHDCFLKGIHVAFDLTFTMKAWTQAERYHWLDIVSSMSTMHMLARMIYPRFIEHTDKEVIKAFDNVKNGSLDQLYSVPSGLLLTGRVTTNYLQLKTIYSQRRKHRLPEWQEVCNWIEKLPYSYLITGKDE